MRRVLLALLLLLLVACGAWNVQHHHHHYHYNEQKKDNDNLYRLRRTNSTSSLVVLRLNKRAAIIAEKRFGKTHNAKWYAAAAFLAGELGHDGVHELVTQTLMLLQTAH